MKTTKQRGKEELKMANWVGEENPENTETALWYWY